MNLEKDKPVQKGIPLEEQKEVWLKAWLAVSKKAIGTSSTTTALHWADVCLEEYTKRFER